MLWIEASNFPQHIFQRIISTFIVLEICFYLSLLKFNNKLAFKVSNLDFRHVNFKSSILFIYLFLGIFKARQSSLAGLESVSLRNRRKQSESSSNPDQDQNQETPKSFTRFVYFLKKSQLFVYIFESLIPLQTLEPDQANL